MKLATLFSGIGSPEQGAMRVYDKVEHIFACEIDKFARQSYKAMYDIADEHFHSDVCELDGTQYQGQVDILVGGSPCQSFSIAGLRKGTSEYRGKLIYEYIRVVGEAKPPIIIYENVKGITDIDGGQTIKDFIQALRDIGYFCRHEILYTKHYGVPQTRPRFYLVGFLDYEHYCRFNFAPKINLEKRLRDIIEDDVDEKYFINRKIKKYKSQSNKIHDLDSAAPTFCAKTHGYAYGYIEVIAKIDTKRDSSSRIYSIGGISPTLTTMQGGLQVPKILVKKRVRRLTPLECWRLQDFKDESFHKAKNAKMSDTQLYKQAGNAMSVNVLEMIFREIEKSKPNIEVRDE